MEAPGGEAKNRAGQGAERVENEMREGSMLAQVVSGAVLGVEAYTVSVEVDLASGLPSINVVGLPQSAVREGRERVTAALANSGYALPPKKITINLAPADIRKDGSAFDLPIAIGLLAGAGVVSVDRIAGVCFAGELGLDGALRPVRGMLSLALHCARTGVGTLVVPAANGAEAAVVEEVRVLAAEHLRDVVAHLCGECTLERAEPGLAAPTSPGSTSMLDLADVRGQEQAKRALEIAAAGSHNLLLLGPPGSGKSMLARCLPGILPPLTRAESLEVTQIHSVAGRLGAGQALIVERPFRAPHHSISDAGLVGGGAVPRPGEASLAHHGVLFLDELPEFRRAVLETLRQPLEEGSIHIGRARLSIRYPARFMLAAAMNPCPCGRFGDGSGQCTCAPGQVERYQARVSGPLMDRIDLHVEVPAVKPEELINRRFGESSESVRERVVAARERQLHRFRDRVGVFANAHMGAREVRDLCRVDAEGETLLKVAITRLGLSARAFHRVLRLARTIADLEGAETIGASHVAEAIQYRALDRRLETRTGMLAAG